MKKISTLLFLISLPLLCSQVLAQSLGDIANSAQAGDSFSNATQKKEESSATLANANTQAKNANQNKGISKEQIDDIVKKANKGDAPSQLALGVFYANGSAGFSKDTEKALEWIEKSVMQKNPAALAYLGYIYAEGKIVKRDMKKAVEYRELAAELGDATTKWTLGNAYLYGFLVPKNQMRALYWITNAAELGYVEAIKKLVEIYTNLNNTEELVKWNAKLSALKEEDAKKGNPQAMFEVAEKYMSGEDGLPRHRRKAIFWYKKAADSGNKDAMDKVAKMYARGKFLPQNHEKALAYFEKLANLDFSYCFKISSYYGEGKEGFPLDEKKSIEWFARGAKNSDASTKIYLVWKYWNFNDFTNASNLCNELISQCEKNLKLIDASPEMKNTLRADKERETLQALKNILNAIETRQPAQKNLDAYFRTKTHLPSKK